MKVALLTLTLLLTSCGYQRTLREHCHIGNTQTCDNLFGVNQVEIDEQQNKEIESLQTMLTELVKDVRSIEAQATQQQQMLDLLNMMSMQQGADINLINQMLVNINQDLTTAQNSIAYQQTRINALAVDVANLNAQDGVIESVYPCGDRPNRFDEALLRMKSGKLIAYFEDSGNRFLTILGPGSYRTTESAPYCYFTVKAQGEITNATR